MIINFFGTPDFAVQFLESFKDHEINIIVTGGQGKYGPKKFAEINNIKCYQTLDNLEQEIRDTDLSIVIAYGKIIPEKIINLPKYGTINLHYSLLPKYRGASPVEAAILNGDIQTGITIQQMVYQLDAGDIIFQEKIDINPDETSTELRNRLNKKALEVFPKVIESIQSTENVPQDVNRVSYCHKFNKQDMDVSKDLHDLNVLYKKYRAYDKNIYFMHKGMRVKISQMNKESILKLIPESRKEITMRDFINGFGKI